jgi:hypothetical protein
MTPRRVAVLVVPIALLAVACSESSDSPPVATGASSVATSEAPTTTTVADTAPETTEAAATTASPTTTAAPTTTTIPAPTTEPLLVRELVLSPDGLGAASFGAEPEGVIEYVASFLGAPTGDTGWIDPFTFAICPGTEVRRVEWGVMSLLFSDDSTVSSGRRHFFAWEYGLDGQIGDEPQGLRTAGGTTLGSRVVDLRAEYPGVFVNEGEEGLFSANFYVSDNFRGLLTGTTDDDVVTVMFGGFGCGE